MKNAPTLHLALAGVAATTLLFLSSCSTAEVKDVWVAPDLTNIHFNKVLVIAATKDGAVRRTFEDAVIASVPRVQAVPSYAFLAGESDISDAAKISAALKGAGFDGIVVMRMVSDRSEVNVTQNMAYPMGYGSFRGYYGGYAVGGTTVTTDRIISVETNIYQFPGEKLIWSGVTESTSPGNIQLMASDAVAAIRQQLIKQKLVPAPAK